MVNYNRARSGGTSRRRVDSSLSDQVSTGRLMIVAGIDVLSGSIPHMLFILTVLIVYAFQLFTFLMSIPRLVEMHRFYTHLLGIPDVSPRHRVYEE